MGSCCGSKPESNKKSKQGRNSNDSFSQQFKEQNPNQNGAAKAQQIDSKKIMKKKENGITIGGADAQNNNMTEDERRRKAAEAAEQRQQANKNRGLSEKGIIELQFKEKNKQEAENYERKNENYNLQWK